MAAPTTDAKLTYQLLHLLQITDSGFPVGGFAHSFGIESMSREGLLAASGSEPGVEARLEGILRARLASELARCDLPLLIASHAVATAGDLDGIMRLNELAMAVKPVWEWREAGARMGRRLLDAVAQFADDPILDMLLNTATTGPQFPVAFGVVAQRLGCGDEASCQAFAASSCSSQLGAAVRLGLIGQRAMQGIIHRLKVDVLNAVAVGREIPLDEVGCGVPLLEIAGMRNQFAGERLFVS